MFHNLLWADGAAYDSRELDCIRNFRFLQPGEEDPDPGIAVTDRWSQERAWKWMVVGPVKGFSVSGISPKGVSGRYNSVRIRVNYNHWKYDSVSFWKDFDEAVALAAENNQTILPVLVTDDDLVRSDDELLKFVVSVMDHYYDNMTVKGWLLYDNPGAKATDKERVNGLIDKLFKAARYQFTNQPVFMTPAVRVKDFAPDFDYHKALIHGTTGGWDRLEYPGVSDAGMVYKIWSLSDVTAFCSNQPSPETGWLLSLAYRFGRPIICTGFYSPDEAQLNSTLERFAMSHVFWYSSDQVPEEMVKAFRFIPIQTQH